MQVVILCGGKGTRIRDVSEEIPKPMIPIGGRPILWHIMQGYARHGFKRFVLCLGYKSWIIKQFFLEYGRMFSDLTVDLRDQGAVTYHGDSHAEDWQVTLAETGLETMTGSRVKRVEKYIQGNHFLLTYGDGVTDLNIRSLVDFHVREGRIGTVTAVPPPSRFGELEVEDQQVMEFSEKPLTSRGWISAGFFVFQRRFLERLNDRDDLVLECEPLQQLAREGELGAFGHRGFWHCMDNSRDFQYLNQLWNSGSAPWEGNTETPVRRVAA